MVWFFEPQCRSLHLFLLVHQNFSLSKWNLLQYRFCHFSLHCVNSTLNNAAFRLYPELWYECWIAQRPNKDHTCLHAPCHAFLSAFDWCFQSPSPSPFRRLFLASLPEPASLLRYHLYQKKKKNQVQVGHLSPLCGQLSVFYAWPSPLLEHWFSIGAVLPTGDIWQCLNTFFSCHNRGCYWHPLGRGQGCYTGQAPLQRRTWVQMPTVPRLWTCPRFNHRLFLVISFMSSPNRMHGLREVPPSSLGGNMRKTSQESL